MGLLDLITGGKSSDASAEMEKALQDIQGVATPTADEMKYQIQKLVQAGVITPEMAQTYLQNPNALASENIDQTGTQAQQEAISGLLGAANEGGLNPAEQAQMQQIVQGLNTQEKGANDAIIQRQAERGALTGGETLAAQLEGNQAADVNANQLGAATAGNAYNQMLQELTSAGSLGSGLQGQENTQANTVAAATNAINQFNAAQQQQEENLNVGNKNTAQAENVQNLQNIENTNVGNENAYSQYQAQLPQEIYSDEMQKAAAEAGVSENAADLATTQGGQNAGLLGGLLGTAGTVIGSIYGGPVGGAVGNAVGQEAGQMVTSGDQSAGVGAAYGGEIHNYLKGGFVHPDDPREIAKISGNSRQNDKIPAMLSEGEIVLPRTVAQNPQPDRVMAFLNRIRKPKVQVHPEDTANVLHALSMVRNSNG
jgi:hypothetical protein